MINLNQKSDCCGCTACFSSCNHNAITLTVDNEGFIYPQFDKNKCVECGLCERVCPIIHYKSVKKDVTPLIYSAINTNNEQYLQSSSGGIFILLCKYITSIRGIVCGAIYDEHFKVKHSFARTMEECKAFQGSKYVQSDIRDIYPKILTLLKEGYHVLFSGTPCQVAGLKLFLKKDYENLYTADLICHGVPSPIIFKDYLTFIKGKKDIKGINMKSKLRNVKGTAIQINYSDGKSIRQTPLTDLWKKLYFNHFIIRPSCHNCQFTHFNRSGDITLGDAWGINKYLPDFNPTKTKSLIFINNKKGENLFEEIKKNLKFIQISKIQCLQPQLQYPTKSSPLRESFWKDYHQYGFNYIAKIYLEYSTLANIKYYLHNFINNLFSRA